MAKVHSRFVCSNCGAESTRWVGKCDTCGEWNTYVEAAVVSGPVSKERLKPQTFEDAIKSANKTRNRYKSGLTQFDVVMGGGLVPGSVALLSGAPGMGKSTLLLQIAEHIGRNHSVLYVSGEEAVEQVAMRAQRLGVSSNVLYSYATDASAIAHAIASGEYALVIVDSMQTLRVPDVAASPGGVAQVASATHMLIGAAKPTSTAVIVVGQVTKEGSIAGPKLLEHMVDCVLHLEGDPKSGFKVLRASKNRFGTIDESVLFVMGEQGLELIDNPSKELLKERQFNDGSVVTCVMQGTRPLLIEIQALVNRSAFGYAKRAASGFDANRLHVLIALLEKRTKLSLADKDIYVNVVGGVRANEPAVDLAVCMAIASADKGMRLKDDAVIFGEVGLGGEVRRVPFIEQRVKEATAMGFEHVVGPKASKKISCYEPTADIRGALNQYLVK